MALFIIFWSTIWIFFIATLRYVWQSAVKKACTNEHLLVYVISFNTFFNKNPIHLLPKHSNAYIRQYQALLKLFSYFSGLKINIEKTMGMWLGQQKGNLQEQLGIAWPKRHKESSIHMTKNHETKQTLMIKLINSSNNCIGGKQEIFTSWPNSNCKTLGISNFALTSSMLHIPETMIKKKSIIYNFIWNGRSDKVKCKIIIQDYEKGGLKMINFDIYVKAAKF